MILIGSTLHRGVWSNILQNQWFGAINCRVHGRRALPPSSNSVVPTILVSVQIIYPTLYGVANVVTFDLNLARFRSDNLGT